MKAEERTQWIRNALRQFEGSLLRYAKSLLREEERAREVVQDTFLKLWEVAPAEVSGHEAQWLFTVCRNRALDLLRKEKRMVPLKDEHDRPDERSADAGTALDAETLLGKLEQLPEKQRECLRLKFQSGLSYKEIAGVTGLSVSNVGFLIHTGIKNLRGAV